MRLLVTGAGGVLGSVLLPQAMAAGHEIHAPSRTELDLLDHRAVTEAALLTDVAVYIQPTVTFVSSADGPACEGASPSGVRPVVRYARTAEAHAERFARAGRRGVVLRVGLLDGPGTRHAASRANDTGESTGEGTVASRGATAIFDVSPVRRKRRA